MLCYSRQLHFSWSIVLGFSSTLASIEMRCNTLLVTLMLSAVVAQAEREFWLIRKDPKDGPGHPENPGGSAGRINTNVILKEDDSAFNDCKSLQDMPELKSNVWKNKLEEPNTKVALDWWRFSSNNWHDSHSDDELFEYCTSFWTTQC